MSKAGWHEWPGLKNSTVPVELKADRADYGKVHRASSDFRWLASTAGWNPTDGNLDRLMNLGVEDMPSTGPFWRDDNGRYIAGMFQPSRAIDARGRKTPIEKHLLSCLQEPGYPPALAAFALFEQVVELDDEPYFDSYGDGNWELAGYRYKLTDKYQLTVRLEPDRLAELIDTALEELRRRTTPEWLGDFYVVATSPRRLTTTAVLRLSGEEPLSAAALPALLLPLSASNLRMSLAGGIPSNAYPREADAKDWRGLCVQEGLSGVPAPPDLTGEGSNRSRRWAEALFAGDPAELVERSSVTVVPSAADRRAVDAENVEPIFGSQPVTRTPSSRSERPDSYKSPASEQEQQKTADGLVDYAKTRSAMSRAEELKAVALLDLELATKLASLLRTELSKSDTINGLTFYDEERNATIADSIKITYAAKRDFFRAWLLAIAPYEEIVNVMDPPETELVRPLQIAAVCVDAKAWRKLAKKNLEDRTIRDMCARSLATGKDDDEVGTRILRWLKDGGWSTADGLPIP